MKVEPRKGWILVKKYKKDEKAGILLLKDDKYKNWFVVQSVYSKDDVTCCDTALGNRIVQSLPFTVQPVEGTEDLFLIKEENIIAVIDLENI